jgi:hypothetical protein
MTASCGEEESREVWHAPPFKGNVGRLVPQQENAHGRLMHMVCSDMC